MDPNIAPEEINRYSKCLTKFICQLNKTEGDLLSFMLATWCNIEIDAAEMVGEVNVSEDGDTELDDDDSDTASTTYYTPAGSSGSPAHSVVEDELEERVPDVQVLTEKVQGDVLSYEEYLIARVGAILLTSTNSCEERVRPIQALAEKMQGDVLPYWEDLGAKMGALLLVIGKEKLAWAQILMVIRLLGWIEQFPADWVDKLRGCTCCTCGEAEDGSESCSECISYLYFQFK